VGGDAEGWAVTAATAQTAFEAARLSERHPLALLRIAADLTQLGLAKRAKVAWRTVGSIERRELRPQMATRRKILAALGVPLARQSEIFGPFAGFR